jgi:hypothetical protein
MPIIHRTEAKYIELGIFLSLSPNRACKIESFILGSTMLLSVESINLLVERFSRLLILDNFMSFLPENTSDFLRD